MIDFSQSSPPMPVPAGYVGPVALPGTGRVVYWTGRVAIGLRYQPPRSLELGLGMDELQRALLRVGRVGLTFAQLQASLEVST